MYKERKGWDKTRKKVTVTVSLSPVKHFLSHIFVHASTLSLVLLMMKNIPIKYIYSLHYTEKCYENENVLFIYVKYEARFNFSCFLGL